MKLTVPKLRTPFSFANKPTTELMAEYGNMYGDFRKGNLTYLQRIYYGRVKKALDKRLQIVEVTPDAENDDLIHQMAGNFKEEDLPDKVKRGLAGKPKDQVHEFGTESVEALKKHRLGGENSNKTAYALIDPESREVLAAIYVYRSDKALEEGMTMDELLPGHVGHILHDGLKDLTQNVTSLIFYSISRLWKMDGEGELLITKLHEHLNRKYEDNPGVIYSTLSPMRGFKKWLKYQGYEEHQLSEDNLPALALQYLTENEANLPKELKDLVRRFHLSNGAEIIGIRSNANFTGSLDDIDAMNYMVHYGYPRNAYDLIRNAEAYLKGEIRVAGHVDVPKGGSLDKQDGPN